MFGRACSTSEVQTPALMEMRPLKHSQELTAHIYIWLTVYSQLILKLLLQHRGNGKCDSPRKFLSNSEKVISIQNKECTTDLQQKRVNVLLAAILTNETHCFFEWKGHQWVHYILVISKVNIYLNTLFNLMKEQLIMHFIAAAFQTMATTCENAILKRLHEF